jgi:hypothetical protein
VTDSPAGDAPPQVENAPQPQATPPSHDANVVDRPHHVSIALSVIAFLFSAASIGISWEAYKLSEATSRAFVEPTSLTLSASWKWNRAANAVQEPLKLEMTVLNSGKSLATSFTVVSVPGLCLRNPQVDTGFGDYPQGACYELVGNPISEADIAPGIQRTYKLDIEVNVKARNPMYSVNFAESPNVLQMQPSIYYADENDRHHEQPCYEIFSSPDGTFAPGPFTPCTYYQRPIPPQK